MDQTSDKINGCLKFFMKIRDPLYGSIVIDPVEFSIIHSRTFQRLKHIKQLGFADHTFSGATHTRFIHSIGTMEIATRVFHSIFSEQHFQGSSSNIHSRYTRFRVIVRLAALLHDIGHGPLSHTSEFAMPPLETLGLPFLSKSSKQNSQKTTHEDYAIKIILSSELTPLIEKIGQSYGFKPIHVVALMNSQVSILDDFFKDQSPHRDSCQTVDFQPLLRQFISSELDADRMDYLRRDSLHTGVSYGQFDVHWLIQHLTLHIQNNNCYLALQHRALYAFEDFLLSRFHMFLMVYFHHKAAIYDEMLRQYFLHSDGSDCLPTDIEQYCEWTDLHLSTHLMKSSNPWAKRIMEKRPYQLLIELHSGIPMKPMHGSHRSVLATLKKQLRAQKIHYLMATSTSELSKYFRHPGEPIFVHYDNHYHLPCTIPLQECTDLFQKYKKKRFVTRIYLAPEDRDQLKV